MSFYLLKAAERADFKMDKWEGLRWQKHKAPARSSFVFFFALDHLTIHTCASFRSFARHSSLVFGFSCGFSAEWLNSGVRDYWPTLQMCSNFRHFYILQVQNHYLFAYFKMVSLRVVSCNISLNSWQYISSLIDSFCTDVNLYFYFEIC